MVVLYRTNAQSRNIEEALLKENISQDDLVNDTENIFSYF